MRKRIVSVFRTVAVALAMFTVVPMPSVEWKPQTMRYIMLAFPLAGVIIGFVVWAWQFVAQTFDLPRTVFAAVLVAIPAVVTGGIHLDGYCDTCDALGSHAKHDVRLKILEDPHVGSSAIIHLCIYLLVYFGLACALQPTTSAALCLGLLYVLERAASGFAVASFPIAKTSGLAHTFAETSAKNVVRAGEVLIAFSCVAGLIAVAGVRGCVIACAPLISLAVLYRVATRGFGGLTGDLSGWFLQMSELLGVATLVFVSL